MKTTRILLLLSSLAVFSCKSNTSSEWSCRNLESKVGCANIHKSDEAYLEAVNPSSESSTVSIDKSSAKNKYSSFEDVNLGQTRLVRTPEKIGRIWVAPYIDNKGSFHEASFVRIVDVESKWEKIPGIPDFQAQSIEDVSFKTDPTINTDKQIHSNEENLEIEEDTEMLEVPNKPTSDTENINNKNIKEDATKSIAKKH